VDVLQEVWTGFVLESIHKKCWSLISPIFTN
jgi:hypothetical protein